MTLFEAIILGLIQGLTEFLPVSSSGHLAIFQNLFKVNTNTGVLFETMLHLGTLIAVCIIFWKDVKNLVIHGVSLIKDVLINVSRFVMNKVKKQDNSYIRLITNAYRKFAALIIITSIPTAILGLLISKVMGTITSTLVIPGICLLITAIILFLIDGKKGGTKKAKATSFKDAGVIGVVQGLAVLPGISRSGSTVATCLMLGMDRSFAIKYSFLASIPAIVGANLLELRHIGEMAITGQLVLYYLVGMIVAGVVGYVAMKFMISVIKNSRYIYFAYYCAAIGFISIITYFVS